MGVDTRVPDDATPEQIDLLRRRVLNVVGHELRTPVTTVAGLAMELAACEDDGRRQELTEALLRSTQRLDHLMRDLLLAAEITTLVPVGEAEPVAIRPLVEELQPGVTIEGDANALARAGAVRGALGPLLENAVVHGEPPVTVSLSTDNGRAVVEISSAGGAISDADVELAAEAFYRGERAVTTAAGLGLGLAVARTLARADGGDVTVRRGTTGGIVARLELPAA